MKAQRMALVVFGVLLMALGGATATYVGPDDTLMIGSTTAHEEARGQAVRTHPAITDFVNIDLLVRAEAPGGVFLGYAHRVDTTDLLEDRLHYTISRMSLGNVGGGVTQGPLPSTAEELQPEELVGWLGSTSGDSVELTVPLDGEPIDVIAIPSAGDELVRVSLGATVKNLFLSQLGVVGVGGVLIAFSFVLGWWARRKHAKADGTPGGGAAAGGRRVGDDERIGTGAAEAAGVGAAGAGVAGVGSASPLPDDWTAALAAASAAVAAPDPATPPGINPEVEDPDRSSAPSDLPPAAPIPPIPPPAPIPPAAALPPIPPIPPPALIPPAEPTVMEPSRLQALPGRRRFKRRFLLLLAIFPLARIFRRRALSRRSFLSLLLVPVALLLQSCGVPGPAASNDGSLSRTSLSLSEAVQLVDDPVAVYAPEFTDYPMWALVATGEPNRLQVHTRMSFTDPWVGKERVRVGAELPDAVTHAIPPGPVLVDQAEKAATRVSTWWSTGKITKVKLDRLTRKARKKLLRSGVSPAAISVSPTADEVRMVEVAGGHLVFSTRYLYAGTTPYQLAIVLVMPRNGAPEVLGSRLIKD